jgi:KDO2-lipid IV(A) lauroyltransferase
MRIRKKVKRGAVYGLTRFMFWFLNVLPRWLAMLLGSMVGLAAWHILPREQYRALRHLGLVFADGLTPAQRQTIGRAFFVNSGKNLTDLIRFRKHYASEIRQLVTVEGLEHFDDAYRRGKGVIGVTGHIGNFELLAVHIAAMGYQVAVIGREMYDQRLNQMLVENRQALGLTNIATTDSPRVLIQWLKQGKALGVLIDNDSVRVRSMHVPAFGRLSNTPVGQTIIALRLGTALVPMACVRTEDDRYKIVIKPGVAIEPGVAEEQQVYQVTLKCTKELEDIIREYPEQWAWFHNRWRTKPKNSS